jgi:hypothetical protein
MSAAITPSEASAGAISNTDDGTEELYDHSKDELEWTNLASNPELASVKKELGKWLPTVNAPDSPKEKGDGEE